MLEPLRITFRRLQPSKEVISMINRHVSKIERVCTRDQITSCHVVVELPHRNKRKGGQYRVRASVTLPGVDAVASRAPAAAVRHSVLQIAIAEAMAAVKRKILMHARKRDRCRRQRVHDQTAREVLEPLMGWCVHTAVRGCHASTDTSALTVI